MAGYGDRGNGGGSSELGFCGGGGGAGGDGGRGDGGRGGGLGKAKGLSPKCGSRRQRDNLGSTEPRCVSPPPLWSLDRATEDDNQVQVEGIGLLGRSLLDRASLLHVVGWARVTFPFHQFCKPVLHP